MHAMPRFFSLRVQVSLFAVFALVSPAGHAAHPYITDDTGTQGARNWQVELQGEHNRHDRSADPGDGTVRQVRRITVFNPVLTYGILDNLDVALGLNRVRESIREDGAIVQSANGMSDSTVELKWRPYEAGGLSLGLKPGVVLPTGDENRGLGSGKLSWGVNSMLTYETKPWVWLVNVAYSENRFKRPEDANANHRHLWRLSVGIAYYLHDQVRLVGEGGVRTNPARDDPFLPGRNGNFAMLGLIYSPSEKIDFDIGIRRSASRAELDMAILLGATLRW